MLIVAAGIIAKIAFGNYDFLGDGISIFSTLWIAAGGCLLVISIFGITVSFGSSTILINGVSEVYYVSLSLEWRGKGRAYRKELHNFRRFLSDFSYFHPIVVFQSMPFCWLQLWFYKFLQL